MLQLSMDRSLTLLLLLGLFASLEAAPSPRNEESKRSQPEKLVRVYSINEEQYKRVLQLTQGNNVISEGRLINGGFATVSDSLSSGWNSLLRIVGLTTLSKADEASRVGFDGQPLCVIRTREDALREEARNSGKAISATDAEEEEESAIDCIVVLKKETDFELPTQDPHQNWSETEPQSAVALPVEHIEKVEEQMELDITTEAPPKSRSTSKKQKISSEYTPDRSEDQSEVPRQYGAGYPLPPPPQYGAYSPYGGYPYSPYSPQSYGPQTYAPYAQSPYPPQLPFGPQQPFGLQQPFGGQSPIGSPYYPQPYYGQPSPNPYAPYSYFEQPQAINEVEKAEAEDDQDEDEDSYEVEDDNEYGYDKKSMIYYKKMYVN
ncbi:GL17048 [Drosophila persimilis]|uniref:GL17048 n=1 Tax=Drosophila persimilis TaxID=7234 RepID=B4GGY1_DROPE|nr:GL17048 [Drosophila persimilis]